MALIAFSGNLGCCRGRLPSKLSIPLGYRFGLERPSTVSIEAIVLGLGLQIVRLQYNISVALSLSYNMNPTALGQTSFLKVLFPLATTTSSFTLAVRIKSRIVTVCTDSPILYLNVTRKEH